MTVNANPAADAPRPLTELEQAMINSRRAGRNVAIEVDNSRGGRPIVSLRELTEQTGLAIDAGQDDRDLPDIPDPRTDVCTDVPEPAPEPDKDAGTDVRTPVDELRDMAAPVFRTLKPLAEELGTRPEPSPAPEPSRPAPAPTYTAPQPCARCGHVPGDTVFDKPDDADKLSYIESVVLGGRAYEKAYRLFDGKLSFLFESSSHEEYQAGRALVAKKAVLGHFRTDEDLTAFATAARVALTLRRITAEGRDPIALPSLPLPADLQDHVQLMELDAAVAKRVAGIGRRFHLAQQCVLKFESNYQSLTYGALEENF